jgi:hypothetical protein
LKEDVTLRHDGDSLGQGADRSMVTFLRCAISCLLLTLTCFGWWGQASSTEIAGQRFKDEIVVEGASLPLRSLAVKEATFFQVDVYAIGLYMNDGELLSAESILSSDRVKALVVKFLIDIKRKKLTEAWIRDLRASCETGCDSVLSGARNLATNLPNVKKGDTITYVVFPSRVQMWVNDSPIGFLEGAGASRSVLAALFGKRAPKRLKQDLLRPMGP